MERRGDFSANFAHPHPLRALEVLKPQLMDRILEQLFLGNIKGSFMILKKIVGLGLKNFSFPVVLGLRGIILPPPIMGQ
jgi:hypothetical protein